ncbi:ABC transporter substrate-binding protein [Ochrobactrum teleogrylli]|uniref:ABC transporter n=1 Tax=Ochrobactrum teleogrylli TaxID=2479765 RepID=A0ABY2Y3E4_9HYPH|nr:ABC transporter substrate-binding protein [[Ochrobactrum] teleogrylli]TNV14075.1 ABC transporter [[Ochrobactrum] teleogrylli]
MAFKIGFHPNNLHLTLASRWPGAFADFKPEFVPYPEGRDTAQQLIAGNIDIGGTGSTPPILAAEGGLPVTYAAASAPRPANGAILVAKDTDIQTVADLKGRDIALVDGSFHTYFLAKSLEQVGLRLDDVKRHDLLASPSRELLRAGKVAAWIAMAPHLEQALASGEFHVLLHCGTTIPNRSVFWTIGQRNLPDDVIDAFAVELARIGREIIAHPEQAAALLAKDADDNERRAWTRVIQERNWHIVPADDTLLREQQAEADILLRHAAISRRLEIIAERNEAETA